MQQQQSYQLATYKVHQVSESRASNNRQNSANLTMSIDHRRLHEDPDFDYSRLYEDPEFIELKQTEAQLRDQITQVLGSRETTIAIVRQLKQEVEESYDKSRKAKIAGTATSVVGSSIAIVGFGLGFVTFGASIGLSVIGGVMASAGGITTAGAEIGYYRLSKAKLEEVQKACDHDRKCMQEAEKLASRFATHLGSLSTRHKTTPGVILTNLKNIVSIGFKLYKIADSVYEAGKAAAGAIKVAIPAARIVWQGAGRAAKAIPVIGVVFDVAFIPVDIIVMIKAAYDVDKSKKTGKSNSIVAEKIGTLLTALESNKKEIEELLSE